MTIEQMKKIFTLIPDLKVRDEVLGIIIAIEADQDAKEKKWDIERQGLLEAIKGIA